MGSKHGAMASSSGREFRPREANRETRNFPVGDCQWVVTFRPGDGTDPRPSKNRSNKLATTSTYHGPYNLKVITGSHSRYSLISVQDRDPAAADLLPEAYEFPVARCYLYNPRPGADMGLSDDPVAM